MLTVSVADNLSLVEDLVPEWLELLQRVPEHSIFQRPEWNIPWLKCFAINRKIYFLVVRDDAKLVGLAPIIIRERKFIKKFNVFEFAGAANYASDYADFIVENNREDVRDLIIDNLINNPDWNFIKLNNVPSNSDTVKKFELKLKYEIRTCTETPAFIINNEADKQKLLSHKSLKRHFNGFMRDGSLKIHHLTETETILPYLDAFFEQHVERWGKRKKSLFICNEQKEFYRLLVNELPKCKSLVFTVLECGDDIIAFHFGLNYLGKFYWYKPSFNIKLRQRSPGEALLQSLFQYTVDNDLNVFDFTVGEEAFKYRFSNIITSNCKLFFCRGVFSYVVFKIKATLGKIRRFILSRMK